MANSKTVSLSTLAFRLRESASIRLSAIAGSAGLAGGLLYWHAGTQIGGYPVWLVAGLLYATMIGFSAALIFRFFPNLGPFVELTSVSRLLLACASAWAPELAVALTGSPVLNATMVVLGAVLIRAAAHPLRSMQTPSGFQGRTARRVESLGGL